MSLKSLEEKIHRCCVQYAQERINNAKEAIDEAQSAANSETKSTAGDKHDTSRAMSQLAVEQNTVALNQALKLNKILGAINVEREFESVRAGALVQTNRGIYYIVISAGKVVVEDKTIFCLSPGAPLAQVMLDKKKGTFFSFNQLNFEILEIY